MRFIELKNALKEFKVFNYSDILKIDPAFDRRRLVEWQKNNYIRRIRNGYYIFSETELNEGLLLQISNIIYKPSYVSLETTLSYYNLIPEAVYTITGISTKKTISFETSFANFSYRHLKEALFFGYQLVSFNSEIVKIADPEKTILDTLYLNQIESNDSLEGMRLNVIEAKKILNPEKLMNYLKIYNSKIMEIRVNKFLNFIYA